MDQDSRIKLNNAGFTILRKDDAPQPRIKYHHMGSWSTLEKFDTKVARDKRLKELLKNDNIIFE